MNKDYEKYVWIIKRDSGQAGFVLVDNRESSSHYWTGYGNWFTERKQYARHFDRLKTANTHCEKIRSKLGCEASPILCIVNSPWNVTGVLEEAKIKEKMLSEEHEDKLGQNRLF